MNDHALAWHPEQPHNQLPQLPPAQELETRPVLKACIEARAALAELKQAAELIPNQAMLINTIPLLEAKDSSEIENIVTTTDRLFQYAQGHDNADPATKEALRYRTALHQGFRSIKARPLCTATAVDVCRTLKGVAMDIRRTPGTQLANDRTGEVVYTPPEGEARLRDMLANWERFLHNQVDLDPLIRMAVGHYQFEAIHPFTDGNGRTGRVLNILYLIQEELLSLPILYLSRHVIAHKADYYRLLLSVTRDGAWPFAGWPNTPPNTCAHACPRYTPANWWMSSLNNPIAASAAWWTKGLPNARPPRATCTTWPVWACCAKCRSARKNSSYTLS